MKKDDKNNLNILKKIFDDLSCAYIIISYDLGDIIYHNKSAEKYTEIVKTIIEKIQNEKDFKNQYKLFLEEGKDFYFLTKILINKQELKIEIKSYKHLEEAYIIMLINDEYSYLENQIFSRLHEAIIKTDNSGKITFINSEASRLLEATEELIGKKIKEVFYPVDTSTGNYIGDMEKVYKRGEIFKFPPESVLTTKRGFEYPVSGEAIPILEDNKIEGMFLFFKDRTAEKQYLDTIIYQQQFSEAIINNLHDGLVVLNTNFEIIKVNKAFLDFTGLNEEKLAGKSIFELNYIEFDKDYLKKILNEIEKDDKYINEIELNIYIPGKGEYVVLLNGNKITGTLDEYILLVFRDITLQKKLQLQLQEDEEKFRTLADSASVAIFIYEIDKFVYINKYAEQLTGYKVEELLGKSYIELIHPEFVELVKSRAEARLRGENVPTRYEFKIVTKNGQEKWVDFTAGKITYKGKPAGIGTAYDITDLKNAFEKLEQLNTTLKVIRNINQLITREHNKKNLLQQSCEMLIENENFLCSCILLIDKEKNSITEFYYSSRENNNLSGREELLCMIRNDEIPQCFKLIIESDELICLDETDLCKNCNICKDSKDKIFGISLNYKGLNYGIILIHTDKKYTIDQEEELLIKEVAGDISYAIYNMEIEHEKGKIQKELEDSEIKYRTIFNNDHTVMLIIDPENGKIIDANPAAIKYYGYTEEQFANMYITDINTLPIGKVKEEMQKAKEKRNNHFIFKHRKANGEIRDVEVYSNPVLIKGKLYLFSIIHDITEKLKKEEELRIAKARAEESDKMKTMFLKNISHEIRTPMNAILGFANLLKLNPSDEKMNYYIDIINNNAEQLLNIIDDIITLSRFESEQGTINLEKFSLSYFLNEVVTINRQQALNKEVEIFFKEPENKEKDIITSDKGKITQILNNFISNAYKYTSHGFIEVGYKYENENVIIYVKDTGIGIREDEKKHIFKPFFRGEYAQQKAIRGTGIGLSISKKLAELMGGKVYFESEYNKGSTFYLELPYLQSIGEIKIEENKYDIDSLKTKKLNIIILEDEVDNYLYLEAVLTAEGHNIRWARDYNEFRRLIKERDYDLLLLDLKIPGLSGINLLKEIRKEYNKLPIIVQSAYVEEEIILEAKKAGCNEYIKKPISRRNLLSIINKLFKN